MRRAGNTMSFTKGEWALVLLVFAVCLTGASMLPAELCPDEVARQSISDWIFETGTLPTGNEMETMLISETGSSYGFSYAVRPFLSAMIAAFFMRIAALFTGSTWVLLVASRMVSVLSLTATCVFCLALGHRLFQRRSSAVVLAVFVCFIPQVAFLGMYQNNDALSLAGVSGMLCCLMKAYDDQWSVASCSCLGIAVSVTLLSYYSAYGWILMSALFCIVAIALDARIADRKRILLKRAILVLGICFALAGWFFIRNALLHNGDFIGLASEEMSRDAFRAQGFDIYEDRRCDIPGNTPILFFLDANCYWIRLTLMSMVGVFGNMDILMPDAQYHVYFAVFVLGGLLYIAAIVRHRPNRRDVLLVLLMLIATGITFALSFWASYTRDFQPQGRYVITAVLFIGYLFAHGLDNLDFGFPAEGATDNRIAASFTPAAAFVILWMALFVWAYVGTASRMLA